MYLSFEPTNFSLLSSADSQSTKKSVSELMVDPVQGMSLIHVKTAKFRHKEPKVTYDSQILFWSGSSKDPSDRKFEIKEMPPEMLTPDSLRPMTTCEIELDCVAADLLNSNEDLMATLGSNDAKKSGNPGLEIIWEDERLRRIAEGINIEDHPLTPPLSPARERSP